MADGTGKQPGEGATITISISRPPVDVDTLPVSSQESYSIAFRQLTAADLSKVRVDGDLFNAFLRDKPEEMIALANDVLAGRTDKARKRAASLGFTEEEFQRQGGGLLFWCGIVACGIMIFAAAATQRQ